MEKTIKVTLKKSKSGATKRQKETLKGLGLTRLNKTAVLKDTVAIKGMINKVSHLISIGE
ncbi:MAG: 50S ribosomal protein L30 [Deltaproteobacteria bacterium GWC2_42_11]|nr:MAG: 50S ribosomal protein L30 [Deltaproteobacteria bacterium GWC2_42_11]HBO85238.1 50S ribosomal protein L30 [Deltaproteobacteria bacterium]